MEVVSAADTTGPLMARAAAGDEDAWREVVGAYGGRVYALLMKQCRDGDLAEELTQATFVKVVATLDRYEDQGRFESWLFRIAMNLLRDEMRRRARQARTMDMSESSEEHADAWQQAQAPLASRHPNPFEQASHAEQVTRVRDAVERLSASDQEILHLRHTAGLTFAQIAESLGLPLGTVLARGHRAVAKLKKLLVEEDTPAGELR